MDIGTSDLSAINSHAYLQLAGLTILYYDYILTFSAEVSHIWPQPISWNTFLFYSNRYIAFATKIISATLIFSNIGHSEGSCYTIIRIHEALLLLNQVAIAAILVIRTVALYHNSRTVIFGVLTFGIVLVGVTCWALVGVRDKYIAGVSGCYYFISTKSAIHLAIAWESSALFDALIFVLTLTRTFKLRKIHNRTNSSAREGLLDVLLRDGALYFAVMALANLANILTYYIAGPLSKGIFSTPASCIAAALCSRLVLNLYEAATPRDARPGFDPYPEPTTAVILTSRIELGTCIDDDADSLI